MPDDPELFSIVPVVGKAPSDAICTGPMSEVTAYIGQSIARIAEEERLAQAQRDAEETERHQQETRAHALQMFSDGITRLGERLDEFAARRQARADEQQRAEEEAQNRATEEFLASLPDPDDPDTAEPLPAPGDGSPHGLGDDGDFEAINPPPDKERHNPEHEATGDTISGLTPPDLEVTTPPEPGDYTSTAPAPSPYRNPAAIGLN